MCTQLKQSTSSIQGRNGACPKNSILKKFGHRGPQAGNSCKGVKTDIECSEFIKIIKAKGLRPHPGLLSPNRPSAPRTVRLLLPRLDYHLAVFHHQRAQRRLPFQPLPQLHALTAPVSLPQLTAIAAQQPVLPTNRPSAPPPCPPVASASSRRRPGV